MTSEDSCMIGTDLMVYHDVDDDDDDVNIVYVVFWVHMVFLHRFLAACSSAIKNR
jgi:hypothetical protein